MRAESHLGYADLSSVVSRPGVNSRIGHRFRISRCPSKCDEIETNIPWRWNPVHALRGANLHVPTWRRMETGAGESSLRVLVHLQECGLQDYGIHVSGPSDSSGGGWSELCSRFGCSRSSNRRDGVSATAQEINEETAKTTAQAATHQRETRKACGPTPEQEESVVGHVPLVHQLARLENVSAQDHRAARQPMRILPEAWSRSASTPLDLRASWQGTAGRCQVSVRTLPPEAASAQENNKALIS